MCTSPWLPTCGVSLGAVAELSGPWSYLCPSHPPLFLFFFLLSLLLFSFSLPQVPLPFSLLLLPLQPLNFFLLRQNLTVA